MNEKPVTRLPILLALLATIIFTFFEFILDGLIEKITIDVYLIGRFIFSYVIIIAFLLIAQQVKQSKKNVFISPLKIDKPIWVRAMMTIFYILMITITFKKTSSQAIAYSFFVLHPIAQIGASRLLWGTWPPIKKQILPIIMIIAGVYIFIIFNNNETSVKPSLQIKEKMPYLFAFIAGCGFAYTNEMSTYIKEKSKREIFKVTGVGCPSEISSLELTAYTISAAFYLTPLTAVIIILVLQYFGLQTSLDNICSYASLLNANLGILFGACILVMLGTWVFAEAFYSHR